MPRAEGDVAVRVPLRSSASGTSFEAYAAPECDWAAFDFRFEGGRDFDVLPGFALLADLFGRVGSAPPVKQRRGASGTRPGGERLAHLNSCT